MIIKNIFHRFRRRVAKVWLDVNLQLTVVGVTGSYGKTITTRAIASVLSAKYSVNQTDINLDTIYNLPITILKTKPWNEVLVLEYGIDQPLEMERHLALVKPKIAVLTGLTPVHTDKEHLGSFENLVKEKSKLFGDIPDDGLAIFNYDDENSRKVGINHRGKKMFYGLNNKADVRADGVKISLEGVEFTLVDGRERIKIMTKLLGYPAVYACLAGYLIGKELGVNKEKIISRLSLLAPLEGRLSLEPGPLGTVLLNDARRANLASVLAGLKTLNELPGRKVAVLGEMGEIGQDAEKIHRLVGKEASRLNLDILVGVGPLSKFMTEEAVKNGFKKENIHWVKNVKEASTILKKVLKKGDLLYLKASLLRHLERVILLLEGNEVCCEETVCHHYQLCPTCPKLGKRLK